MIEGRTRSWSRAGLRVDYRLKSSHSDHLPRRLPLHQSRFQAILNASTESIYEKVQKALEMEETRPVDPMPSTSHHLSFYFRSQSRKDAQRKGPETPEVGKYRPNFDAVWRRNPAFRFDTGTVERCIWIRRQGKFPLKQGLRPVRAR